MVLEYTPPGQGETVEQRIGALPRWEALVRRRNGERGGSVGAALARRLRRANPRPGW
jgi:hypothetical protein